MVMVAIDFDPIARGYVASLPRTRGRVTGLFFQQIEQSMKRVELAKEAFAASSVAAAPAVPNNASRRFMTIPYRFIRLSSSTAWLAALAVSVRAPGSAGPCR